MLRKAELKHRDLEKPEHFRRHFRILYEFFSELVQLASTESGSHWLEGAWQGGSIYLWS